MGRRPLEIGGAALVAIAATVLLTYPLAFGVKPSWAVCASPTAAGGIWVVAWVAHALTTNPLRL